MSADNTSTSMTVSSYVNYTTVGKWIVNVTPTINNISNSGLCSFNATTFYVPFNPLANTSVAIEAPCTKSLFSDFNISNSVALPSHIEYTANALNST